MSELSKIEDELTTDANILESALINHVLLFWIAFIFTRPFGATFGDFLTKPLAKGGLDLPREYASMITFALLAIVLYFSLKSDKRAPLKA